jgi:sugar phosphate isomerase/epimerase
LRTIREIGYDGWVTVELYPYAENPDLAARLAWNRVRELLDDVTPAC